MLLLFFLVWIIFNGAITTEICIFGVVVAFLMFGFVCKFMDYSWRKEKLLIQRSGYFLLYLGNLLIEIVRANVSVCHFVLSDRDEIHPVMVSFHTTLKSGLARVILTNSITLTPGTITVSLQGDEVIVHCLDRSLAEGMENSSFVKMLEHMERIGETNGNL
ncbi:Mrp complex subunit E1 [uncultured Clostridium sp.]|uniref:Na+/H+ antiporter subunit E n=1 Tax=Muricoprocola aceti TaxID=2981772 RepID=A0ABT2SNL9_9FIRM|nr:Na+/H+ antiporter subunit E [Muricoprocola aceti]MCI7226300.1 Na+/H+ antiporter subunit E [Lachnospiraceae bacterium]MCQ4774858.1 Na+/H+ antiporter subunit E [Lacrimispora saccharolytica]SCH67029.1 Mrp complex subunit E1 [uncultured Clostridium sp.]MCU6725850.1 Na+/H+ antiporter subunit E [Muricoprocola aceti]MDD7434885.1 Na+/H+ antiporter subunit E [Lachnospiraceae bacterium]